MRHSSKRVPKSRLCSTEPTPATVPFPPSEQVCERCMPISDDEVAQHHPLAILPDLDFVLARSMSYRELRLLQIVKKAVEAAQNVLDEHGEGCEGRGCEVCRNAKGLLWALDMAHGMLESQLPVS